MTNGATAAGAVTLRTLPAISPAPSSIAIESPSSAASIAQAAVPTGTRRRWRVSWKLVGLLVAVVLIANEVQVTSAARELGAALPSIPRGQAEAVWERFRQLDRRSFLRVGTAGLRRDVKDWFVGGADELIADYRSDTPVIRENGWRAAMSMLRHADALAPRDHAIRARLLYCRGQLARINAQALKSHAPQEAMRRFNEATHDFEEAARLWPHWVDPQLGLARTYVYGLEDPDRAQAALGQAQRDGYEVGNRDQALLADGYRLRAEKAWASIADLRDLPDEDRYLKAVRNDEEQALDRYQTIPAYGEVSRNIRRAHGVLDAVERREDELRRAKFEKIGLGILAPLFGHRP